MKIDKDNTGVLFSNKDKKTDKHPNLKGLVKINGIEFWASGWVNIDQGGDKYISLKFKPKESKSRVQQKLDKSNKELDDNIPF